MSDSSPPSLLLPWFPGMLLLPLLRWTFLFELLLSWIVLTLLLLLFLPFRVGIMELLFVWCFMLALLWLPAGTTLITLLLP